MCSAPQAVTRTRPSLSMASAYLCIIKHVSWLFGLVTKQSLLECPLSLINFLLFCGTVSAMVHPRALCLEPVKNDCECVSHHSIFLYNFSFLVFFSYPKYVTISNSEPVFQLVVVAGWGNGTAGSSLEDSMVVYSLDFELSSHELEFMLTTD